jgi:uncharacterized protein (DUF1501 family)
MDFRPVFKSVLATHLGVSESGLAIKVFGDTWNDKPMLELVRRI